MGGEGKLPSSQCQCAGKSNRERWIITSERQLGVEGVSYSVHGNVPTRTCKRQKVSPQAAGLHV